ncbi:heat shock factor protein 1-like isoform X1 [Astyanax mexicanus]|uniref:Heat shock factor protein 1-like isoform X1 n=1 Tax=Astyanax mexicanus TaxID=7994 RepID=A0A8B9JBC5_ASTMX|nr:heat shock factor protein 1-like isoform X1 [Astyanax mexicanus]
MKQNYQVPAFLTKLWTLVDDSCTNELVCWSEEGCSFIVLDEQRFSKEVLPLYYKHCNMTSFIRQLNMYGFHKVVPLDSGLLKEDGRGDSVEFQHEHFRKDQPHLLTLIHRKVSVSRGVDDAGQISQILVEISQARGWQDSFDFKLMALCRDNESLWRELNSLQQKHQQQHRIICKIMQFIINTVGSKGMKGLKRKLPMIEISGETHSVPKYSRPSDSSVDSNLPSFSMPETPSPQDIPQLDSLSPGVFSNGMVFSDITHLLEPLPEQDSDPVVENTCPTSPLSPALSPVDLTLSLLDDPAGQDMAEKLAERNELVDPLSLIDSSLAAIQAYPLSPSLDTLDELFRPTSESDTHTPKRKRETKQGGNTHSHKYTAGIVRPVLQHEDLSFGGDSVEADILPSLLRLAQEASIPLHTDTLSV